MREVGRAQGGDQEARARDRHPERPGAEEHGRRPPAPGQERDHPRRRQIEQQLAARLERASPRARPENRQEVPRRERPEERKRDVRRARPEARPVARDDHHAEQGDDEHRRRVPRAREVPAVERNPCEPDARDRDRRQERRDQRDEPAAQPGRRERSPVNARHPAHTTVRGAFHPTERSQWSG